MVSPCPPSWHLQFKMHDSSCFPTTASNRCLPSCGDQRRAAVSVSASVKASSTSDSRFQQMPVQLDGQHLARDRIRQAAVGQLVAHQQLGQDADRPPASRHGPHLAFGLGTNRWLSATRLRPKARATNSTAMSSLRLNER